MLRQMSSREVTEWMAFFTWRQMKQRAAEERAKNQRAMRR